MTDLELAWLAGLLEGEGSFMKGPPSQPGKPIIAVHMTDQDVVQRVADLFGGMTVQFRAGGQDHHKDSYFVSARGDTAARLMILLQPHLSARRQTQIKVALDDWRPSKFLDDCVRDELVARAVAGESMRALAEEYGVSYSYVKKHKYASPHYKKTMST